jgi:cytoskeletal protein CcmA (bactofilin family)
LESFNGIVIEDDQTVDQRVDVRNLQVYGNAVFWNEVEADEIEIFGTARFRDFVSCDRIEINGEAVVLDSLLSESVKVGGVLNVSGRFRSDVVVVDGMLSTHGKYNGTNLIVRSRGRLEASRDIKAEKIILNGVAYSGAAFKSETVEIASCEKSEVARIVTTEFKVKYKPRGDVPGIQEGEYLLSAYHIDTLNADIEYVAADTLECENIRVGPGCHIGELIYKNEIEIDDRAIVDRLYRI